MGYDTKEKTHLSVTEAAQILGISRMHVIRLIHDGTISAMKVGKSYIIEREAIGGTHKQLSAKEKKLVEKAVDRTLKEYGEVIKKLGKE